MTEHPAVQARMQEEADRVLGTADWPPDYASTASLHYIEAVAHETMRHRPVAPFLWVEPTEDIVIGDVHVPKGNPVNVLTAHVAMAAANFADSKSFRPERWLEAAGRSAEVTTRRRFCRSARARAFVPVVTSRCSRSRWWLRCCAGTSTSHGLRMPTHRGSVFLHDDAEQCACQVAGT